MGHAKYDTRSHFKNCGRSLRAARIWRFGACPFCRISLGVQLHDILLSASATAGDRFEVVAVQIVRALAATGIDFGRDGVDQVAVRIKGAEQSSRVGPHAGMNPLQRVFSHEKRCLHRAIVPPKSHRPPRRVVRAALIRETRGMIRSVAARQAQPPRRRYGRQSVKPVVVAGAIEQRSLHAQQQLAIRADLAFAAKKPHAAAWRRCADTLDNWLVDTALSLRCRRERDCLSVIGARVRHHDVFACR